MTDYIFIVNLSTGNTSPEYIVGINNVGINNVGNVRLPVNLMPAPLIAGDTITFSFYMNPMLPGVFWELSSCEFYCWPHQIVGDGLQSPFYNDELKPIVKTALTQNSKITIRPANGSGNTLWSFALSGICRFLSFEIPFFVDPEAACSSGA